MRWTSEVDVSRESTDGCRTPSVSAPQRRSSAGRPREERPVSRRLGSVTLDNLDDLPRACRRCVFWELDPVQRERAEEAGDPALEKEAWVSTVLLEWGSCGKIAYVDGMAAGYVLFAPPAYIPRSVAFPSSPVSPDAVLLMTSFVRPEFAGTGLGRMLVQGVAKDLRLRGIKAIEAFGDLAWKQPSCVLPADHLLAVGFKTVRPHRRFPRLRLELRTTLSWREDVEYALERLLGSMTPDPALRPAGA
jgi:GNAT superfamily N-acetyltransferase